MTTPLNIVVEPVTFPSVMRLNEVAAFMRRSPKSILNSLSTGTFLPLPFAERPYRWRGEDVERWYRGDFREPLQKLRRVHAKRRKVAA